MRPRGTKPEHLQYAFEISDGRTFGTRYISEDIYQLGATGLNWLLAPGTYWVTYETRSGSAFSGFMPSPSASPLLNEAFQSISTFNWVQFDSLDLGVRILGDSDVTGTPVPEPTSLLLLGTGLAGLCRWQRRSKRRARGYAKGLEVAEGPPVAR